MALLSIKNDNHLSLSRGEATALALLDLSAALVPLIIPLFPVVFRIGLGFAGSSLKWFSSYLSERYQSVKIGSTLSDLQKLLFGVPQGSVLRPLLFSLYTSPLSTLISKHKCVNVHFYSVNTSYPMDNCFTGQRNRSRQTPEKDVLYIILAGPVSSVHARGGASYLLPVQTE